MSVFVYIPSKTTGIISGNLIWSSFSRKKEHGCRIQTFWLFWPPHPHPLNCSLVTKMQDLYLNPGKVLLPDHYSSSTMETAACFLLRLICLDLCWDQHEIWVCNFPDWYKISSDMYQKYFYHIYFIFMFIFPIVYFQRGKEWATFGHQTRTWEHRNGVQKASTRGNTKLKRDLHTNRTSTQKHFNHIIFFQMLLLDSYYCVAAVLPGFNQLASDLTL